MPKMPGKGLGAGRGGLPGGRTSTAPPRTPGSVAGRWSTSVEESSRVLCSRFLCGHKAGAFKGRSCVQLVGGGAGRASVVQRHFCGQVTSVTLC